MSFLSPVSFDELPLSSETAERTQALQYYDILDTAPEEAFDEITALAAAICGVEMSSVSFICIDRAWSRASWTDEPIITPIEDSFCAHAIAGRNTDLFEVLDATKDPRFVDKPSVTGELGVRYYAGMPLLSSSQVGIGALCVVDKEPRTKGLSELQRQTLRTLANQVTTQLELRRVIAERDLHALEQHKTAQEMQWIASHDPLTGLGNRSLFQSRLQDAISTNGRRLPTAVMILDVDHFKHINDTLGHDAGDDVLRAISDRLVAGTRTTDTVARLGGDEFGVILQGIATEQDIQAVTRSIFARLQQPITHRDRQIDARLTIGAAIFPDHALEAADLIRHADIALYAAKAGGRGRAVIFDPEMLSATQQQVAMINRARTALADQTIVPFYQPQYDFVAKQVIGFEALLRLRRPDDGFDPPSVMAAAFDDAELARNIGIRMLTQVVADMRRWIDQGVDFGRIAVNASACEFRDPGYATRILETLEAAGVPANRLEIEVTETVLLDRDALPVERALLKLTEAGVLIALDDFGTGYASLSHLNRFPVHVLKIDRSFVNGIEESAGSGAIVHAILNMADNLSIDTVAEGIETVEQADYLRARGCRVGQGYLYGRAQAADLVPSILIDIPAADALRTTH